MSGLALLRGGAKVDRAPADLAGRLIWLTRFGKPAVSFVSGKWWARIEMHVADSVKGSTFKIESELVDGPEQATDQLIERMLETLIELAGNK